MKRALSAEFLSWLNHPGNTERIRNAGMSVECIRIIKRGECSDHLLFLNEKILESVGLSADALCVAGAKRELWGDRDPFPHIRTREALVTELAKASAGRVGEVKDILRLGSPAHLHAKYVANYRQLRMMRVTHALRALHHLTSPAVTEKQPVEPNRSRAKRVADSATAGLNALAGMASVGLAGEPASYDSKLSLCHAAARLLLVFGIDAKTITEFQKSNEAGGQSAVLAEVANLFQGRP